jgi:hypothetical protein
VERGSHVAPLEQPKLIDDRIATFIRERVLPLGAAMLALLMMTLTTACHDKSTDRPGRPLIVPVSSERPKLLTFSHHPKDAGSDGSTDASSATPRVDAGPPEEFAEYVGGAPVSGKSIGHTSVVFKLTLKPTLVAAFKPDSKRGPGRYKGEIAAYRFGRALGIPNVPPAIARSFSFDALLAALGGKDNEAGALLASEVTPDKAGQLRGAVIPWLPHLSFLSLEADPLLTEWKGWLAGDTEIPADKKSLAAQISTMLVFDYLTGNWDRWSGGNVGFDATTGTVLFVDNDGAFYDKPPPAALAAQKERLQATRRFSRGLVDKLRRLTPEALTAALGTDGTRGPMVGPKALGGMIARQYELLKMIDADIAKLGDAKVLSFD